jgi:hypothetical protein
MMRSSHGILCRNNILNSLVEDFTSRAQLQHVGQKLRRPLGTQLLQLAAQCWTGPA